MTYDELIDEYTRLHKETFTIRTPRPKHLPIGASWTTKEMMEIVVKMEEIIQQIELQATKEFYLEVEKRLNE